MSGLTASVVLAAARATDLIVLGTVALGAAIAIAGIASVDPRVRTRLPIAVLARGNLVVAAGFVVTGLLLVAIALGFGG